MVRLSVNINKVATIRNSRGANIPNLIRAAQTCIEAGCPGITVHPREDERHITRQDVFDLAGYLSEHPEVEFNVEGDARDDLLSAVLQIKPAQMTLVPVLENETTSQGGWPTNTDEDHLKRSINSLKSAGVRVSVFVNPTDKAIHWAKNLGADRVELYTEPFAVAYAAGQKEAQRVFEIYQKSAQTAHSVGLGINAGHDLDLNNLKLLRQLPYLDEVSIGHALISEALFQGLSAVTKQYLDLLSEPFE